MMMTRKVLLLQALGEMMVEMVLMLKSVLQCRLGIRSRNTRPSGSIVSIVLGKEE